MKCLFIPASLTVLILSGCASYHAASLNTLSNETIASAHISDEPVLVAAKAFSKADCKRYLDRDVLEKGYQPVQLYIQNNSDKSYLFSLNRVGMSCARPEAVAEKVHTSTVGRAAGYGAAALVLWPMAIPAVVDGVKSAHANEALDNDFDAKAARDQAIAPHAHFNKLLFVPVSEYQQAFVLTLIEQGTNQPKTFNVFAD